MPAEWRKQIESKAVDSEGACIGDGDPVVQHNPLYLFIN